MHLLAVNLGSLNRTLPEEEWRNVRVASITNTDGLLPGHYG